MTTEMIRADGALQTGGGTQKKPDFDVVTAPLLRPTLLEASAGTGKTFSIKHLVLRLVVEERIPVSRLLVMTFTRTATAELKSRIEAHLTEALALLEAGGLEAPQVRTAEAKIVEQIGHWRGSGIDDATAAARIRESLAQYDNAAVSTIHGFCQKVLEENAFSSGGALGFDVLASDEAYREDAVRDYLRREIDRLPDDAARRELVEGEDWLKKLEKLTELPPALEPRAWGEAPEGDVGAALGRFLTDAPGELRRLKRDARVKTFNDLLKDLYEALMPEDDGTPEGRRRLERAERLVERIRSAYRGVLVDEFQDTDPLQYAVIDRLFLSVFARPADDPVRAGRAIWFVGDPKQAIYGFRGADLNTYLLARRRIEALGARERLGTNYRSSAKLLAGLEAFFTQAGEKRSAFLRSDLVFEPVKASKKRVGLWLRDESAPGGWRESEACELWTYLEDVDPKAEETKSAVNEVMAWRIARLLDAGRRGLAVVEAEGDDERAHTIPINGIEVSMRGLEARDVAVLVRANADAKEIARALALRGVRSRYESQDEVTASEEAQEVLLILRAFAAPGDLKALRAAQATRFVGDPFSLTSNEEAEEKRRIELREVIESGARRWATAGPAPALRRLMDFCRTTERLLPVAGGERVLANYAHLIELLHGAARSIPTPSGLAAWLAEAGRTKDARGDESDRKVRLENDDNLVTLQTIHKSKGLQYPVIFLPHGQRNAVLPQKEVVHKGRDDAGRPTLVLTHRKTDALPVECAEAYEEAVRLCYVAMTRAAAHLVLVLATPTKPDKGDGKPREWNAQSKATRSGYYCALMGGVEFGKDQVDQATAALEAVGRRGCGPDELPGRWARRDLNELLAEAREDALRLQPEAAAEASVQPARARRAAWRTSSFTGISRMTEDDAPGFSAWYGEAARPTAGSDILDFPKGAQAGTCLHEMLELADFEGMAREDEAGRAAALELCRREVERHLSITDEAARERAAEGAAQMIRDVLNAEIAPGVFLREVTKRARTAELEFLIPIPAGLTAKRLAAELRGLDPKYDFGELREESLKGFLTGFIDLAFMKDGRFWVLDWKSNKISPEAEGYTAQAMDEEMRRHLYRLQYLIYLVALRRFLRARLGAAWRDDMLAGALYVFLRGVRAGVTTPENPQGVVCDVVRPEVIRRLDDLFSGAC